MNKIDYRMCLAFRFKAFPVILSNSWNTHITYIIFKDIKKANKFLFSIHIKMTNNYYQKNKGKLRKEACEWYQNLSEKEKCKKAMRKISKSWLKKKKNIIRIFLRNKRKN